MLRRRQLLALALATLCVGCDEKVLTVFVVRHAEKEKPSPGSDPAEARDPALTAEGRARAAALPIALGGAKLDAIFSSQYRRTQQTVAPVAEARGLEVQTVDARDLNGLVDRIRALQDGSVALVSGHSNTVPAIIDALGVAEPVELGHDDHGDLFVVTTGPGARVERRRFGR